MPTIDSGPVSAGQPSPLYHATPQRGWRPPASTPLLLTALAILLFSLSCAGYRLSRPHSADLWESGVVAEGFRVQYGMPVYGDPDTEGGHASHMYGALYSQALGSIYGLTGGGLPALLAARVLNLICSIALIFLIVAACSTRATLVTVLISLGLLFGLNLRSELYFTNTRPDMLALLLSGVAVVMFYIGQTREKLVIFLIGAAVLLIGFLMKQTAAIFTGVPPLVLAIEWLIGPATPEGGKRFVWPRLSKLLLSLVPFTLVVLTIIALKLHFQWAYFFMFTVPGRWGIPIPKVAGWFVKLLLYSPVFFWALYQFGRTDFRRNWSDRRLPWLFALLFIAVPFSALAMGREGGVLNSGLPGLFAMMAFAIFMLQPAIQWMHEPNAADATSIDRPKPRLNPWAGGVIASALLAATCLAQVRNVIDTLKVRNGDAGYAAVVTAARALPGTVFCPDDPTIPAFAKGEPGRCGVLEYDVTVWQPGPLDARMQQDMLNADWAICVAGAKGRRLNAARLIPAGYEQVMSSDAPAFTGAYSLWRRTASEELQKAARSMPTVKTPHPTPETPASDPAAPTAPAPAATTQPAAGETP